MHGILDMILDAVRLTQLVKFIPTGSLIRIYDVGTPYCTPYPYAMANAEPVQQQYSEPS
jgi:hypothetical protein